MFITAYTREMLSLLYVLKYFKIFDSNVVVFLSQVVVWNESHQKLTSSDQVTIGSCLDPSQIKLLCQVLLVILLQTLSCLWAF